MKYRVLPKGPLKGVIRVPGDKSISHRALLLAAIAEGQTRIRNFLKATDTLATARALQTLGVSIEILEASNTAMVTGVGLYGLQAPKVTLDLGNSGTAMRLLTGLLAGQNFDSVLTGDASLCRRPMHRLVMPLNQMGAKITASEAGTPPIKIKGGSTLSGIHYSLPIPSAQLKSGLLLAGLYAQAETCVIEEPSTRDHTERLLQYFQYPLRVNGPRICLAGGHRLIASDIFIPGDLSSAAFFLVAASVIPGSAITLREVGVNPRRMGVIEILKQMGANIVLHNHRYTEQGGEPLADITVHYAPLHGITIPVSQIPSAIDELPIVLVAAACAKGVTILREAAELRVKESDRIDAMVSGLQILGISSEALPDGVIVEGGKIREGEVDSFGDHRIAMAFAIAGAVASGPVTVRESHLVKTSFPNFVPLGRTVGIEMEEYSV